MIIIVIILLIMFITFPDFRKNWISSYQWIEKESGNDVLGKVVASLAATIIAPVMTIISSIKHQLVNNKQKVSEPTSQERYDSFVNWFNAVLSSDLNSDEDLKSILAGWNWFNNGLVLHFKYRPKENELSDIAERLQSYNMNFGWAYRNLGELYLHNFDTTSNWSVPVLFIDKIVENEASRVAELARVEREKELDSLPIDFGFIATKLIPNEKGELPLWLNRQGEVQFSSFDTHMLLTGATGSGKTSALLYLIGTINMARQETSDKLYILDYKRGKDWSLFVENDADFYTHGESTKETFEELYKEYRRYLAGDKEIGDRIIWVIIDEFSSIVESFPTKKERDEFLRKFGEMLRLSRNIGNGKGGYRFIVGLQQADASVFNGSSTRGNFGIRMALGGLTTEGARMVFDVTEQSDNPESSKPGKGFIQVYGYPVKAIMMPHIQDHNIWLSHTLIWDGRISEERVTDECDKTQY
ncbi:MULTISPECIES: hypothetical protein [unclassified Streptococcus]|uniref:hypothetical protein n=1 Tax=unclassified Streptococcus TaxID=2608887 RepID=UPI0011B71D01|nr:MULTISPECIES: hypothetical protein [unclassified Streptococcus]TWS94801.1 hypothetical protein FRX52_02465 [Streptococcus sp. sy018]TWT16310.1 hypothetical protein FRX51_03225 [Streptococcus sp. sy010]